eukprot:496898-Prymnesium_polylepis.1
MKVKVHELRNKSKADLTKQLEELKTELAALRVAKRSPLSAAVLPGLACARRTVLARSSGRDGIARSANGAASSGGWKRSDTALLPGSTAPRGRDAGLAQGGVAGCREGREARRLAWRGPSHVLQPRAPMLLRAARHQPPRLPGGGADAAGGRGCRKRRSPPVVPPGQRALLLQIWGRPLCRPLARGAAA